MSILEAAIIAALIVYSLFLLIVLVEYITDKRAHRTQETEPREEKEPVKKRSHHKKKSVPEPREEIPQPPGPGEQPQQPPKEWKEEEFE